ncbi:MAG: class I SAM-dependent methyltransferase, partial [Defluviitaleaceae bacterium]|nr:class I SAM-dependent methyltransferase [Defluviitaleaceae bacterium]
KFISRHWYAYAYEQFETYTDDVEFLLKVLRENTDGTPQNILEVACGGGRICIPLAQAGHIVTGFDADEFMLLRCYRKMEDVAGITCYRADALEADWGGGFDVVVLAGNILINIETETDYAEAQQTFIRKAAAALRKGGRLLLDYDQHSNASAVKTFNRLGESGRMDEDYDYTDELGTKGKFKNYGGVYDPVTRICTWASHKELLTNNGERIIESTAGYKHIPSLKQVYGWLADAGLAVEKTYGNYSAEPLDERHTNFVRATIWARKG